MTIDEFINALGEDTSYALSAEVDEQGTVYIYDTYDSMMASLRKEEQMWKIEPNIYLSPVSLRLMDKLADTPPAKRTEPIRYVILNSKPRCHHWDFFRIGDDIEYLKCYSTTSSTLLTNSSYTFEELEKEKRWLPEKWRNAIDNMLTPLNVALEEGKHDHMEQDRPSCTVCRGC